MKYCANCGAQLPDDAQFCGACGAAIQPAAQAAPPQPEPPLQPAPQVTPSMSSGEGLEERVQLCQDGIYRWVYEFNMFKSMALLGTILKIFGILCGVLWLVMGISSGFDEFGSLTLTMLAILGGICVLAVISYLIVAAMNGGKYCVLFEMDNAGLKHIQLPRQFKKAQVAGWIAMLAGVLSGNPVTTGAGILAAARNSLYSDFSRVRNIKPDPAHNIIKVNAPTSKNQVYVSDQDFQFVLDFIRSHCPKAK